MKNPYISFDWAVKRLLRNKANFGILEGFLSELLKQDIRIHRILESERNQQNENDKFNRVDILAEDTENQLIIVEIQNNREVDYFHRMLYGASALVTEYINLGEEYSKIRKIFSVNIVYFDLGQGNDYVYHGFTRFTGLHNNEELLLSPRQRQLFSRDSIGDLFPEYYVIKVNQFNDIAKEPLDEWIYYLKNADVPDGYKAKGLSDVRNKLSVDKLNGIEKSGYLRHLENLRDEKSVIFTAKDDGIEEGFAMGKEEGRALGLEEGKVLGLEEGKVLGLEEGKVLGLEEGKVLGLEEGRVLGLEEGKVLGKEEGIAEGTGRVLVNLVRNMLESGESIEKIIRFTGLSKEEIEGIRTDA